MRNIDWNLLKSFVFVVQEGSLSGAARALSSTQPTIGRHIETLEEELKMKLFVRSKDGLSPTQQALDLLPDAKLMINAYQSFLRQTTEETTELSGVVRVAVSEVMAGEVLPKMLMAFQKLHPFIKIEISVSNKTDDLINREADLAIRLVEPRQTPLVSQKLGVIPIRFYAHKDYISKNGRPRSINDLKKHKLIGPDADSSYITALAKQGYSFNRDNFYYRTDNQLVQLQLLKAGLGICVMQEPLAKLHKELIPLLGKDAFMQMPVWLVMHEDLKLDRKVRSLYLFLVEEFTTFIKS